MNNEACCSCPDDSFSINEYIELMSVCWSKEYTVINREDKKGIAFKLVPRMHFVVVSVNLNVHSEQLNL